MYSVQMRFARHNDRDDGYNKRTERLRLLVTIVYLQFFEAIRQAKHFLCICVNPVFVYTFVA